MNNILGDETLDDLQIGGLYIIQKKSGFRFGVDAVLLSDFAKNSRSDKTLDLCTGNAIVPLLLSAKTETPKICGLEIQADIADMAKRSVDLNNLNKRVEITEGDLINAAEIYGKGSFDKITCNPPYMKRGSGLLNTADTKVIARHEVLCTLEDVIRVSAELLIPSGRFYMVHRPSRMADIFCLMREYRLEPKEMRLVAPSRSKAPNLLLISGMKGASQELKCLPTIYVYNEDGEYSNEIDRIYGRVEL